jgi:hypothetical protein
VQDRVPAFAPEKAKAFIEKEMGCSIDVVYKEFEERPIAAASLGQVFDPKLIIICIFLPSTVAYSAYHKHIIQSFFLFPFPDLFKFCGNWLHRDSLRICICLFLFLSFKTVYT